MNDEGDNIDSSGVRGFLGRFPPYVAAALIFALPFIVVDFFNYYSAGAASILSFPVLALLYALCGALAAHLAASGSELQPGVLARTGAITGVTLWFFSTVVNTIISLLIGGASLGVTLFLGVPYLCCCAPLELAGGALTGAVGGLLYGLITGRASNKDSDQF